MRDGEEERKVNYYTHTQRKVGKKKERELHFNLLLLLVVVVLLLLVLLLLLFVLLLLLLFFWGSWVVGVCHFLLSWFLQCDVIMALCSYDVRVARKAADLWLEGYGYWLVMSGKTGNLTQSE